MWTLLCNSRLSCFLITSFFAEVYDIPLLKDENYLVMKPSEHNSDFFRRNEECLDSKLEGGIVHNIALVVICYITNHPKLSDLEQH